MKCKHCGSNNVNVQAVTTVKNKKHGLIYWCCGGFILDFLMAICFFIPWLIIKIFRPKKIKSKVHSIAICQDCGHRCKV